MPTYKVYVQETNIYIYDVEADTPEEAAKYETIEDSHLLCFEEKVLAVEEASTQTPKHEP